MENIVRVVDASSWFPLLQKQSLPGPSRIATVTATAVVLSLVFRSLQKVQGNYERWLNLGPGAFPCNIYGWLKQWLLWPLGIHDETSLCMSRGSQAVIKAFALSLCNHARQKILEDTIAKDPEHLRIATSALEGQLPAIFLADHLMPACCAAKTKSEIAHIHNTDGSSHVSLMPVDASEVVEKGWGQRHPLSHRIHIGFTLLYAPRNEAQVEIVKEIYQAACAGMVAEALRTENDASPAGKSSEV
ncbi:MAG: hypothetical protein Q9159_003170 [Coniocarpon cinnabarinum]